MSVTDERPGVIAPGGEDTLLKIGDVAQRTGLTQRTIRYYEQVGLLPSPVRTQGEFRLFSERDVARLERIVQLKGLFGFSLADIRTIVRGEENLDQLRSEFRATGDISERITKLDQAMVVTEEQIALIEYKVAQMNELRAELERKLSRYASRRAELKESTAQGEETSRVRRNK